MARRKDPVLGELIGRNAKVLKLLDKYGITFCAGCYLTLFATPEKAAHYHAVPDAKKFLKDLRQVLK
jgi:hypothetical protein